MIYQKKETKIDKTFRRKINHIKKKSIKVGEPSPGK
jgi:hypothetical protein